MAFGPKTGTYCLRSQPIVHHKLSEAGAQPMQSADGRWVFQTVSFTIMSLT